MYYEEETSHLKGQPIVTVCEVGTKPSHSLRIVTPATASGRLCGIVYLSSDTSVSGEVFRWCCRDLKGESPDARERNASYGCS
jgi:hypothetical protein